MVWNIYRTIRKHYGGKHKNVQVQMGRTKHVNIRIDNQWVLSMELSKYGDRKKYRLVITTIETPYQILMDEIVTCEDVFDLISHNQAALKAMIIAHKL